MRSGRGAGLLLTGALVILLGGLEGCSFGTVDDKTGEGEGEGEGQVDTHHPPVLRRLGTRQVVAEEQIVLELKAVDPDLDPITYAVYGHLPGGAKFDKEQGRYSWTPTREQVGKYYLTFAASDGKAEALETVMFDVVAEATGNKAPRFIKLGDQTLQVGVEFQLQLEATDPEGDALTYMIEGQAPDGATLNSVGLFVWTPTAAQVGLVEIDFKVSDGKLTDQLGIRFVVSDGSGGINRPPVLAPIGNRNCTVGEKLTLLLTATDPDGHALAIAVADGTLPAGASLSASPQGTGKLFQWTPTADQDNRSFTVIFEVSDVRQNPAESLTDREEVLLTVGTGGGEGEGEGEGASEGEGEGAGECVEDGFEENDDQATAAALAVGSTDGLRICGRDRDWFSVPVAVGSRLTVRALFAHAQGDIDLALFGEDGGETLGASTSSDDDEEVVLARVAESRIWIMVYVPAGVANVGYSLSIEVEGGGGCPEDPGEPNESRAAATPVSPGTPVTGNICPEDVDTYSFQATRDQSITVRAEFDNAAGDLDLYLLAPDGRVLDYSEGAEDFEEISLRATTTGLHYAQLYGYDGDQNDYSLLVTLGEVGPSCTSDRLEPNDTRDQAKPLDGALNDLMACVDQDWFLIQRGDDGLFYFTFTTAQPQQLSAIAYRADGTTPLGTASVVSGTLELWLESIPDPTFYLVVGGTAAGIAYSVDFIAE